MFSLEIFGFQLFLSDYKNIFFETGTNLAFKDIKNILFS